MYTHTKNIFLIFTHKIYKTKHRSQTGSTNGPTNSSHGNIITDEEEESIASHETKEEKEIRQDDNY
jgi:hypothetical protein